MQYKDNPDMKPDSDSRLTPHENDSGEVNLFEYIIILLKHKKLIFGITLGVAIVVALISLIMQPIYLAETKILPPQQNTNTASQILGQLGAMAGLAAGALNIKSPNDLYIGLLRSRPVLDSIVDRFNLMSLYHTKSRERAREIISHTLSAQEDKKSGMIVIGIEDNNPKKAADIANAFVEELRSFNRGLAVTEASQRRLFFEEQLKDTKEALVKSEEDMKGFQEKTGAIKIDEQARTTIDSIAQVRAQIAAKEVQVKVMRTYATSQNPDIQKAEEELKGLKEQLGRLESRNAGKSAMMPTGNMPSISTEYSRKVRELKFNETLYELLMKQYEAAKLDEARDAVIIQVVEKAIPPEQRVKPKRTRMVIIAAMLGFFASIFVILLKTFVERMLRDTENKNRFEMLKKYAMSK